MQNTLTAKEREKLEVAINEEVQSQIDLYKRMRDEDLLGLIQKLESSPPKEAKSALDSFNKAVATLKEHGYMFKHG